MREVDQLRRVASPSPCTQVQVSPLLCLVISHRIYRLSVPPLAFVFVVNIPLPPPSPPGLCEPPGLLHSEFLPSVRAGTHSTVSHVICDGRRVHTRTMTLSDGPMVALRRFADGTTSRSFVFFRYVTRLLTRLARSHLRPTKTTSTVISNKE